MARILDDAIALLERQAEGRQPAARPGAGEAELLYYPLPEGWVGFVHSGGSVVTRVLDCDTATVSDSELSRCLLSPFSDQITQARQLRILPYGELRMVDFHALPFDGEVLLSGRPVVYGLDLGVPGDRAEPQTPVALVVADPRGDLPAARDEALTVRTSLERSGGWRIRTLEGAAADAAQLRRELPGVDLFHYAGHAEFAGAGGWDL